MDANKNSDPSTDAMRSGYDPRFFDKIRAMTFEEALPMLRAQYSLDPRFQTKEPSRALLEAYYNEILCHQE